MRTVLPGILVGAIVAAGTTIPADAMIGPTINAAIAAQRARALTFTPQLRGTHTFTIITASKSAPDLAVIAKYFRTFGLSTEVLPNTKDILITGTYAQATAAAHISLESVFMTGETVVRGTRSVTFPGPIAKLIAGTTIIPGAHFRPLTAVRSSRPLISGPAFGYSPSQIAAIYDIAPVYAAGTNGTGVNVAIVACSDVTIADVAQYGADFGLPALHLKKTFVDGVPGTPVDGEAILDAERVYGTAPGASIYEYLAPDCSFSATADAMVKIAEDSAKYHFTGASFSYSYSELNFALQGLQGLMLDQSAAIAELTRAGVPFYAASGDNGSWSTVYQNTTDVSYPASDSNAIAIGGTTVEASPSGTRLFEYAWSGSGGGVSGVFTIPAWQAGVSGVASRFFKNVPDVAMIGDPNTGVSVYVPDYFQIQSEIPVGGTSVAAPTFNGVMALVENARSKARRPYLSNIAAALYAHQADFVDVVNGGNGYYTARPGYDNVSGIGVPDVAKMVHDAVIH